MNHLIKSGIKSSSIAINRSSSNLFQRSLVVGRQQQHSFSTGGEETKVKAIYDQSILQNYESKVKEQQKQPKKTSSTSNFVSVTNQHPKLKEFIDSLPPASTSDATTKFPTNFNKPEITTLPNGIKVISLQRPESACAIGLYIKGGSNYETEDNRGIFHLLEKMVFKSTENETSSEIAKKYENISLNAMSSSSKGVMQISLEVLRKDVEYILKSFSDQITCPLFKEEDIEEQKQNCAMSYDMMITSPEHLLPEILLNVAYGDEGYGHPLIVPPELLEKIDAKALRHTISTQYVGKNIVIAATGIDHPTLVKYVSQYFSSIPYTSQVVQDQQKQQHQQQNSTMLNDASNSFLLGYKGGSRFFDAAPGMDQSYYLAFPAPGLRSMAHSNDVFIAFVLQTLLGGGSAFSSGGPGKEVERAKRQQKSLILMNLELRGVIVDDMARQLLTTGVWRSPDEICRGIDSVTIPDILNFIDRLTKNTPSIVALIGDKDKAPNVKDLKNIIGTSVKKVRMPSTTTIVSNNSNNNNGDHTQTTTTTTITFNDIFKMTYIRSLIFNHVDQIFKVEYDHSNKGGDRQRSLKGRDIIKLPYLGMISRYAMPLQFIRHYLPPTDRVLPRRRVEVINRYHRNATLDTLEHLLEFPIINDPDAGSSNSTIASGNNTTTSQCTDLDNSLQSLSSSTTSSSLVQLNSSINSSGALNSSTCSTNSTSNTTTTTTTTSSNNNNNAPPTMQQPQGIIGNYIIVKTIGRGQFGKVKLGYHRKIPNEKVAIKIINKSKLDQDTLRMVQREVRIMKLLNHPNIIKLYEVIETNRALYLIMEYAGEGEVMDFMIAHGVLSENQARTFFIQIVSAMAYCHSKRAVHRDLKPENLLLDTNRQIKIIDFGLSNVFTPGSYLKTFCGSPTYASPELILRKEYNGPSVDIWSMGVVLFCVGHWLSTV
ncbi:mitochondrial processing peptidase alpha subunit [Cavenderia fasciculata]|uniref:non-specific serine/threonine protein kinase n=1 Tax=Cavenderia fasciculata TaxID=261658 RepID=F4Q1Y2_CACFS|nr:mitochondrial processing peptidase alpha subunit [Cavenderia fasciculata]EGG18002.1 mitochondrial processing peptidase alpha subunit [Cavenderia fasciculata]|eukprot:XP_004356895.1 mitochondrial processing peptidase alpha subunit [Cavenderia fasciculata]